MTNFPSVQLEIYQFSGLCLIAANPDFLLENETSLENYVEFCGRKIRLSNIQFHILYLLIKKPGVYHSREVILDWVAEQLGCEYDVYEEAVRSSIKNIRKKIFPNTPELRKVFITTKYGRGYTLRGIVPIV